MKYPNSFLTALCVVFACASFFNQAFAEESPAGNPHVKITTNHGTIEIELLADMAPLTVENFLQLVDDDFYDGLVFHRVIANFMIQGGGYTPEMTYKDAPRTVANESNNGVRNRRGTVAMARMSAPDSADSQFFINVADNTHLDATPGNPGYTVFGRVVNGADTVEKIELVNTHLRSGMAAVPEEPIMIVDVERL